MQYVHFKTIKIVNFLSTGKKPVTVSFRPGLNIITGKNYDKSDRANGVGKSTIADAIHFALYGSTIRDLKKENIVNNLFPEELCEVELEFSVEENNIKTDYKIIRTLNPTKCFLFVNGEDKTRSGVPQTTEFITDIINTSSEVFQNSVVMTINNTVPFMAQKKVEKRKFIEGILGLEVFSNMLLIARSEFNDAKRLLDIEISKNEETERSLVSNIKQKETFEENRKKRKEVLLTRQTNNQNELIILNDKLSKLESVDQEAKRKIETDILTLTKSKTEYLKKNRDVEQTITEAATLVKVNTDRIKKLKKVDSKCPHCGKDLAEAMNAQLEKDKNDCEAEIAKYNLVIETNRPLHKSNIDFIEKIDNTLSKLNNKLNNFALRKKEVENYTTRISQLTVWQNQLKVDIEQIDTENNTFDSAIKEIEARITEIKTNINNLQEKIDIIESAKFITSEEGVKSFIVKKILEVLNLRLAYYLKKLESNSVVKFNEFFEETITNERGSLCSYFNFSGAERKAIDLAMLFTFQDIRRAQANVWLNLSMFDELLDSSLDEKGIELVLDILRERVEKYQEAVYVISHRKESMKYCTNGEIIFLEKKNGVTTRTVNFTHDE
jgi:DNA repair exonuclease SbcCD ATPase subunit